MWIDINVGCTNISSLEKEKIDDLMHTHLMDNLYLEISNLIKSGKIKVKSTVEPDVVRHSVTFSIFTEEDANKLKKIKK
jgi:hypothetical protein